MKNQFQSSLGKSWRDLVTCTNVKSYIETLNLKILSLFMYLNSLFRDLLKFVILGGLSIAPETSDLLSVEPHSIFPLKYLRETCTIKKLILGPLER
jgi:hypothetical protein